MDQSADESQNRALARSAAAEDDRNAPPGKRARERVKHAPPPIGHRHAIEYDVILPSRIASRWQDRLRDHIAFAQHEPHVRRAMIGPRECASNTTFFCRGD